MIKEQIRQFFATKKSQPKTIHMEGGSLKFKNLPKENQTEILKRLAEKDEVAKKGFDGILPGLTIDGKVVTVDNIKEFEIKPGAKDEVKNTTYEELKKLNKVEQVEILKSKGVTKIPNLEDDRIKLILELQ